MHKNKMHKRRNTIEKDNIVRYPKLSQNITKKKRQKTLSKKEENDNKSLITYNPLSLKEKQIMYNIIDEFSERTRGRRIL